MFLLVPAYPGCPGSKAVKRSLLLLLLLSDVLSPKFENLVWQHATKDTSAEQEQLVALLRECIMIGNNVFTLPNFYTVADVKCIISYVYSSG